MDLISFAERYREMSTDELLYIYNSSDLVEPASMALQAELEKRGVTGEDIAHAKTHKEFVNKNQDRPTRRLTKILVNVLGVLITAFVLLMFAMFKKGALF